MKININDLKKISELLLDYIKKNNSDYVEIKHDYYWFLDKEELYNPYDKPNQSELTLGQLSTDWENLEKILRSEDDPVGYALVWLSSILRYLGDEIP